MPACTERNSRALDIPMLACSQSSVRTVTVFGEKAYLEAKYTAPNVCPRLLNIGKQIIDRCGLSRASVANRGSEPTSSKKTLALVFKAGYMCQIAIITKFC